MKVQNVLNAESLEFVSDMLWHESGHLDVVAEGCNSSGIAVFEAAENDHAGVLVVVTELIVEGQGDVGRLSGVDVKDTVAEVLTGVLTTLVGGSLLYEFGLPFVEIGAVFDSCVF